MKALEILVADAVVDDLNGSPFSQSFVAERLYAPDFDLKDMKALKVTVIPRAIDIEASTRDKNKNNIAIDIAIQKKFTAGDPAEIDPLALFVEEVRDHFQLLRLASFPNAIWTKTENTPLYDPEHFLNLRQFTSVITLTFRVLR